MDGTSPNTASPICTEGMVVTQTGAIVQVQQCFLPVLGIIMYVSFDVLFDA